VGGPIPPHDNQSNAESKGNAPQSFP
jgi:hypothetical protein